MMGNSLASKSFEPFDGAMTGCACINQRLTLVGQYLIFTLSLGEEASGVGSTRERIYVFWSGVGEGGLENEVNW